MSGITLVILHNDNNGPFVLIRELNHFLLSVWPELFLELSSCHLRCIHLNFGMVFCLILSNFALLIYIYSIYFNLPENLTIE